jgi:protein Mpv17
MLRWYVRQLHARPLSTKARSSMPPPASTRVHWVRLLHGRRVCRIASQAATSAAIAGLGDVTVQLGIEKRQDVDAKRLVIFTALGGCLVGPTLHRWYSFLHQRFPGDGVLTIGKRLLLDQALFAPSFIPAFLGSVLVLEGHPEPKSRLSQMWWPAVLTNWSVWVPAQCVNFALVPPHFQVLFANGVAVAWNGYLSWASHQDGGRGSAPPPPDGQYSAPAGGATPTVPATSACIDET